MSGSRIKGFLLSQVSAHPTDIVKVASENFQVSPQAVHRHLRELIKAGSIRKTGRTKAVRYELVGATQKNSKTILQQVITDPAIIDEHRVWETRIAPILPTIPENVRAICEFGVTEILNNARDHSQASRTVLTVNVRESGELEFLVTDDGVGIFEKIRSAYSLDTRREAVLQLSKGKFTTDPERHSGQGIFFSSRAFDQMGIVSGGLIYLRFKEEDWLLDNADWEKGTSVRMIISPKSKTDLAALFEKYAGEENDYSFATTHVAVALAADESFVSRSQAKRITFGLEKFKRVVLDFRNVRSVGQGFVDEVFRVFAEKHPETKITFANANENVQFMIKRTLSENRELVP